jgi:hypothetical protein
MGCGGVSRKPPVGRYGSQSELGVLDAAKRKRAECTDEVRKVRSENALRYVEAESADEVDLVNSAPGIPAQLAKGIIDACDDCCRPGVLAVAWLHLGAVQMDGEQNTLEARRAFEHAFQYDREAMFLRHSISRKARALAEEARTAAGPTSTLQPSCTPEHRESNSKAALAVLEEEPIRETPENHPMHRASHRIESSIDACTDCCTAGARAALWLRLGASRLTAFQDEEGAREAFEKAFALDPEAAFAGYPPDEYVRRILNQVREISARWWQ